MNGFMKDELFKRLIRLDEDADLMFDDDKRFSMVIVGGSALILLEVIARATSDIDALDVSTEIVELLERYDINVGVSTFINNFPYNHYDRLIELHKGRKIDFYSASLEDIVIAKLYSGRDKDRQDITSKNVLEKLDWDILEELATSENEARASALNEFRYNEFKSNYDEYVKRWRP